MTKTEKKLQDKHPTFLDELTGLSIQALEARLLTLAKGRQDTLQAQDDDEDLQKAKEEVKELSAPYRDAIVAIDLKMRYLAEKIKG